MASFEDLQATLDEMMYGDAPASWEEIKAFLEKSTGVVMAAAQEEEIRQNYQREVEVLEIERQTKENKDIEMFRPDDEEKPEGEIRTFEEMEADTAAVELAAAAEQAAAEKLAAEQAAAEERDRMHSRDDLDDADITYESRTTKSTKDIIREEINKYFSNRRRS